MPRNRSTPSTFSTTDTLPLLLGTELVRADVAAKVLGLRLGEVPLGGLVTWALFVDAVLVGRTDETLTDEAAQGWARRMLGDGVRFQLVRPAGGYWLADAAVLGDRQPAEGGWPS
jgi:hypothetical protein